MAVRGILDLELGHRWLCLLLRSIVRHGVGSGQDKQLLSCPALGLMRGRACGQPGLEAWALRPEVDPLWPFWVSLGLAS